MPVDRRPPTFTDLGDRALLITIGDTIDLDVNARVHRLAGAIRRAEITGIRDVVPAYASLAVCYEPIAFVESERSPASVVRERLEAIIDDAAGARTKPREVELPVCYGGEFGPDLEDVAKHTGLADTEVVERHVNGAYTVYFVGFTPGFPYLGGLDPKLATPRRATPRDRVPAGSVGIAGDQTGVYPCSTPGGWNLIGRTPLRLFDPARAAPCLLLPGDRVRFVAIAPERFASEANA